jgi:hypothetical protein
MHHAGERAIFATPGKQKSRKNGRDCKFLLVKQKLFQGKDGLLKK